MSKFKLNGIYNYNDSNKEIMSNIKLFEKKGYLLPKTNNRKSIKHLSSLFDNNGKPKYQVRLYK